MKAIYNKLRANVIVTAEKVKPFSLKPEIKISIGSISVQYVINILAKAIKQVKECNCRG